MISREQIQARIQMVTDMLNEGDLAIIADTPDNRIVAMALKSYAYRVSFNTESGVIEIRSIDEGQVMR